MNKKIAISILIFLLLFSTITVAKKKNNYFTVVSEKSGDVIFETAMDVSVGDYYINEQNKKYKIIKVNEKEGIAKFEETVKLITDKDNLFAISQGLLAEKEKKLVSLYHTHSSESYKPTSGTDSEPKGDIHAVSEALAKALRKKGIEVDYNESNHNPHDGGAYERSRRTATRLVRKRPDAIFDVHRDGVPNAKEYVTNVNGKKIAKVRLVVGRQNPQMQVNDKFAKQIKAVSDKYYPGLIKGIYYAKGKYNQDLSPRSMLLEMGTHVISAEQAIASTDVLSNVINKLLYGGTKEGGGGTTTSKTKANENSGAINSIIVILAIVIIGGGLLLAANEGGFNGAVKRIKSVTSGELSNSLGIKKDEDENGDEDK